MSLDYALFRKLHRMLKQLTDIRGRMDKGPRMVKIVTANEAQFLTAMDAAKEAVTKTRMAADAKQMQLGEREAKIEDLKGRLNACDSNKEFQLLKDRIAADLAANSVLQDEILEQLERLDTLVEESDAAKANYAKSQEETKKMTDKVALELKALESELERVTKELAAAENELPIDIVGEYRRLVAGMGEDALGLTDTETCGNCNQQLITQRVADLMMGKAICCQGCGCLMYLAENHPSSR